MRIVVCVRQGLDGEINPFDACAYEAALEIKGAEITLLSMGPARVKDFLLQLTRLGAERAILLPQNCFCCLVSEAFEGFNNPFFDIVVECVEVNIFFNNITFGITEYIAFITCEHARKFDI